MASRRYRIVLVAIIRIACCPAESQARNDRRAGIRERRHPVTGLQGRKRGAAIKAALASLFSRSRAEIQTASGVVVGVAGASPSVEQGEIRC
jgi:hypothetical protein